jgi:hypothetical protein
MLKTLVWWRTTTIPSTVATPHALSCMVICMVVLLVRTGVTTFLARNAFTATSNRSEFRVVRDLAHVGAEGKPSIPSMLGYAMLCYLVGLVSWFVFVD